MKKFVSILLAAALACLCLGGLAESFSYNVPQDAIDAYMDIWVADSESVDASIEIWFEYGETVAEGNLALDNDTSYHWVYDTCSYDAQNRAVTFTNGVRTKNTVGAGGDLVIQAQAANLTATFAIGEDGRLTWQDDEGLMKDVAFLRLEEATKQTAAPVLDALSFEGTWVCGRASIDISAEDAGFKCSISWADSAATVNEWEYACLYDAENKTLVDSGMGAMSVVTYAEDGTVASREEKYTDGRAIFAINDTGKLTWDDKVEHAGADMEFEKTERVEVYAVDGFGGFSSEEDVNCFVDDEGHYIIQIAVDPKDAGAWVADESSGEDGLLKLYYGDTLENTFVANYEGSGDGTGIVAARHMVAGACDEIYTWELKVSKDKVVECVAGGWGTAPDDAELDGAISGAWADAAAKTRMTVALNKDGGWDAEIEAAEGVYKLNLRYDCDLDRFVYIDGELRAAGDADGAPIESGLTGAFALEKDGTLRWENSRTPETALTLARAQG